MRRPELDGAACILSAFLLYFSWHLPLLAFVALIPWLHVMRTADPRRAWRKSYLFGLIFGLTQLFFIAQLTNKWTGSPWLSAIPWVVASVLMAIYFGLVGMLVARCFERGWPLAIPLVWAGMEIFRSYIPMFAFPWGLLGTPFVECPVVPSIARLGTIYLVSAWAMLPSLLLFAKGRRQHLALLVPFFGLALVSLLPIRPDPTVRKRIMVAQPGIDVAFGEASVVEAKLRRAISQLMDQADQERADLVIFPEGMERLGEQWPPELAYARPSRTPVVIGAQRGASPIYQSAVSFDGRWNAADKTRLVIFGEFVPFRSVMPFLQSFNLPTGDLSAGEKLSALPVAGMRVGPLICFEALFPDLAWRQRQQGAQILAVMSIDDWFRGTNAPEQLRAASIWRSYETGIPLVRSASTGASLMTDTRGRVVTELPAGQTLGRSIDLQIPVSTGPEPAQLLFPALALGSLIGIPLALRFTSGRNRVEAQSPPDADSETGQSPAST